MKPHGSAFVIGEPGLMNVCPFSALFPPHPVLPSCPSLGWWLPPLPRAVQLAQALYSKGYVMNDVNPGHFIVVAQAPLKEVAP